MSLLDEYRTLSDSHPEKAVWLIVTYAIVRDEPQITRDKRKSASLLDALWNQGKGAAFASLKFGIENCYRQVLLCWCPDQDNRHSLIVEGRHRVMAELGCASDLYYVLQSPDDVAKLPGIDGPIQPHADLDAVHRTTHDADDLRCFPIELTDDNVLQPGEPVNSSDAFRHLQQRFSGRPTGCRLELLFTSPSGNRPRDQILLVWLPTDTSSGGVSTSRDCLRPLAA
eukprot:TRINITY_DN5449_c0_g1_i1.p1 TRINITY_DN5449_c0_g1~~TRINITY_DN5449_c0_g1_i1.p1  ORF type:complete len:226 (-),score=32.27 TRINITY_DN5449_c0_g1_i1:23-700(-)